MSCLSIYPKSRCQIPHRLLASGFSSFFVHNSALPHCFAYQDGRVTLKVKPAKSQITPISGQCAGNFQLNPSSFCDLRWAVRLIKFRKDRSSWTRSRLPEFACNGWRRPRASATSTDALASCFSEQNCDKKLI
jgi:hypothetical protein